MQDCSADFDDDFEDAVDVQPAPPLCPMDLDASIMEAKTAVHLFFNNEFSRAKELMDPWADCSMYHALGSSVFKFLEAVLTFEQQHIEVASEAMTQCLNVCDRYRKKSSVSETLGKMFKGTNYDLYTPEEVHAELCYAEALLLKSILTFIEDETLASFIKAGFKIRSCLASYRECNQMLRHRQWTDDCRKVHFESGIRMGIGAFNLMISLLPARIVKLLEVIGMTGNKEVGLQELGTGYQLHESLRQVLCVMVLLGYHLIVVYVLSHADGDTEFCEEILRSQLQVYPQGVWFLFFKGRLEFMKGNVEEAVDWYTRSWRSQNMWPQFHHLCFWELMFTNCALQNWREAAEFAGRLVEDSRWSKTIYSYQKAAMLAMLGESMSPAEHHEMNELMTNAPKWRQRIAGKSIPMEKFVIKRCARYQEQKRSLVLPALELLYVWNLFKVLAKRWGLMEGVFRIVERALKDGVGSQGAYAVDNRALLLLLRGACLRHMRSPLQAEECLREVVALKPCLREDHFLVPNALTELALLCMEEGDRARAISLLEDAKNKYSGYSLESRLHFRIHSALSELQQE